MGLGNTSVLGKKYLIYFVKSPYSETDDDAWLCAGAIVTPTQILTAAACLVQVNMIYAIAGNKKYVHGRDIDKDKCANTWKKKIIRISVPKDSGWNSNCFLVTKYTTQTPNQIEWMNVDIGVATVEDRYDFNHQSYLAHCSYIPESIKINFDKNNEKKHTRAIALGWGGNKIKSKEVSKEDKVKPKVLEEATTVIIDKTFCAKVKNGSTELVNKYLLCASGNGFLGNDDETTSSSKVEEQPSLPVLPNDTQNIDNSKEISSRKSSLLETCQNDHGGPLITWVGTEEVILGVALNGICNPNFDCVGPRIYVSTAATAKIIECLLETNHTRRKACNDQIYDKRYQVNDIEIKWPEDIKSNSSLSTQQSLLFRRQRSEEDSLHLRPTKDLRTYDEQEIPQEDHPLNPLDNPQENQQDSPIGTELYLLAKNPQNNRQRIPQSNPAQNPYNEQQQPSRSNQNQGILNEEYNNRPRKPVARYISQQHIESQNQPEVDAFNEPHTETQNQPRQDTFNQAQMDPYNQPPSDSYYNQPPVDPNYNQPPVDFNYNESPTKSKYPPKMELYSPQSESYNEPPVLSNNQKPVDPYNQQQIDISNQQYMASQNQPQRQTNTKLINNNPQIPTWSPPQMESFMPSQEELYNQPQIGSYKNPLKDILKLSSFKKTAEEPFAEPQEETLKQTAFGSFNPPPSKVKYIRQEKYYNKKPQSAYNPKQIESHKPVTAESYNPLDIIMAEDEPEEDEPMKPLMEEPYKPPSVEMHKQTNVNPYMPQPIKPERLLSKKTGQPFEYAPALQFDPSHVHSALREGSRNPAVEQDESQTFEKMFSQLHAGPEAPDPPPPSKEETFDELFRDLHDGDEETSDKKIESQIEQEAEQMETRLENEPQPYKKNDAVQVRQQVPLEYPDYTLKSRNA